MAVSHSAYVAWQQGEYLVLIQKNCLQFFTPLRLYGDLFLTFKQKRAFHKMRKIS